MGYTIKSIAYQFKGSSNEEKEGNAGVISRIIHKANNTESENIASTSYESYSKNIMEDANLNTKNQTKEENNTINNNIINNTVKSEVKEQNNPSSIKKAFNVGKEFMNLGMYMAERKKLQEF